MKRQLEGEPSLVFQRMITIDGNNSQKRMAAPGGGQAGDTRVFHSDRFLTHDFVDGFGREIASSTGRQGEELEGTCTSNWKAAASDDKKWMWSLFEETGIFACACRHGFLLWIADMVRSGEQ